jgi:hypothetical protein
MKNIKEFLLSTPFFSGKVPPLWANISHFSLGMIIYSLLGLPSLIIPILKEAIDLWLWDKKLFSKHHKLYTDLAGWYAGILCMYILINMIGR